MLRYHLFALKWDALFPKPRVTTIGDPASYVADLASSAGVQLETYVMKDGLDTSDAIMYVPPALD